MGTLYLVAIKREVRKKASRNWKEELSTISELTVHAGDDPFCVQIEASEQAIEEIRSRLGHMLDIEQLIRYRLK